jgi:hypothetical protein
MSNPFQNIQLKNWPDYWLAVNGISFVLILGALVAGQELLGRTVTWVILFGGFLFFGIGAKKSHYKAHVKGVQGNMNVWVSKWRHSFLADAFAIIGIVLVTYSIVSFSGCCEPNN